MRFVFGVLMGALVLGQFACAPAGERQAAQRTEEQAVTEQDRQFAERAAQIHMTSANLGQQAQERGRSQDVRSFGQTVRKTHTDAYNGLRSAAQHQGISIPEGLDPEHQQIVNRLKGLSGQEFDRQFLEQQAQFDQRAADLYRQHSSGTGSNPALREHASKMIPVLQNQAQTAQSLRGESGPGEPGTQTAAPAGGASTDAGTGEAQRGMSAGEREFQATVTRHDPGKVLELKVRDWAGVHRYNLNEPRMAVNIDRGIRQGAAVRVIERVDQNGRVTLTVEPAEAGAQGAGGAAGRTPEGTRQPGAGESRQPAQRP